MALLYLFISTLVLKINTFIMYIYFFQIILHTHLLRFSTQKSVPFRKFRVPKLFAHAV
jgi:hypothetical protein